MAENLWSKPQVIEWTQLLLSNFERLLGYQLIAPQENQQQQAKKLFQADFVIVSHGIQADPILNYGNQTALDLWAMSWQELTKTPSRLTAEPVNREERKLMLDQASKQGYINNYSGIRIASTGQRFYIDQAIIWNLEDSSGEKCGQAATFSHWQFLDDQPDSNQV